MSYPEGSVPRADLFDYARFAFQSMSIKVPLKPQLKAGWSTKVQGEMYCELWVRYYALFRHEFGCMACCSDYANIATGEKMPIVRDRDLDLELLLAHAQLQHWINQQKKGQNNGRTRSNRTVTKAVAGR